MNLGFTQMMNLMACGGNRLAKRPIDKEEGEIREHIQRLWDHVSIALIENRAGRRPKDGHGSNKGFDPVGIVS